MPDSPKLQSIRVEQVKLADLSLLDHNARFMPHEQFARLVENLRRDGALTSVPFAWKDGEDYLVLSGNHRVKAAIEAGIEQAFVMLCDDPMPSDRRIALQLAHNAIAGEDDLATLKQLYDGLEDIDWRQYAGLDDKTLELLDKVEPGSLSEANLDFQTVTIAFLPAEKERAEKAWEAARPDLQGSDDAWLAVQIDSTRALDALDAAGRAYGVTNIATALMIVLTIFERNVAELQEGFLDPDGNATGKRMVPTASVVGFECSTGTAAALNKALSRIVDGELAESTDEALALLANEYLTAE